MEILPSEAAGHCPRRLYDERSLLTFIHEGWMPRRLDLFARNYLWVRRTEMV
jgi:hypothetical protein